MRARKKKNCDARLERCSDYIIDKIVVPPENDKPVFLEIGCGKGRFAVETAEKENCLFFAVEIMKDIIVMAIEKGAKRGLDNIKYKIGSADDILEFCPENCVDTLFLNFCDPWPKKRNAKRRLTYRAYLEKYKKYSKKTVSSPLKPITTRFSRFPSKSLKKAALKYTTTPKTFTKAAFTTLP